MKRNDIHVIGISEGEEKDKGPESIFKAIMAEKIPKPGERNGHPDPWVFKGSQIAWTQRELLQNTL